MIDPIRQQQAVELANELIGRNTPIETIIEQYRTKLIKFAQGSTISCNGCHRTMVPLTVPPWL